MKQVRSLDMHKILASMLSWQQQQQLDQLLPVKWQARSGSSYAISYEDPESPVLAVPLQEMYGVADSPELANARIRVLLKLLSPAGRPLQITTDLAHFWDHAYKQVQKEMKGRYPKHHWPDDPASRSTGEIEETLGLIVSRTGAGKYLPRREINKWVELIPPTGACTRAE